MRSAMLAGVAALALCGPAAAQEWVPPRPGEDTCAGWDTPEARAACETKEADERAQVQERRRAEEDRTRTIVEAEDKRIAAERAAAEAARQAAAAQAAETRRLRDAADAAAGAAALHRVRLFDFGADEFGRLLGEVAYARGTPLSAKLSYCSQPGADGEGVCEYESPPGVEMSVASRPGGFRARRITVTWDGSFRGMGAFARRVAAVCAALAPEQDEREAMGEAAATLGTIGASGTWSERRWTAGRVAYVIRPDPQLGHRDAALFTAEDIGADAAR